MKKKIFKKNRLVILALSVMIGVAGYLNFNAGKRDDLLRQKAKETNADAEVISYDSDKADATEDELTDQADQETMGISDNTEVGEAASENTDTTYLEKAALEENVELNSDEEDIGEAVLTSAQTMKSNLATAKLNREQSRARSKEALLAIINDETMDSAAKDEAVNSYVKLTDTIEKETDAETVLTAKGYTDCIVTVNDDTVDVTLPVANLSDTERAQVEDIVTRKTGYDVSQLVITVAEDK
ncbi:MAG: SpoIIIAH-like family protein [Coprococcus sp.]|jgi:stage III sporulation protein AH|uniref:SpoIIIAH-like family protein n=1 Tax=Clostridium sp. AF15-41 TaxID=2292996 RepID=UPI000E731D97|nr:SpoIIIAH-like family protein [Clostridium sp. AF15-41]RJW99830.1 SpoIIIAH-like family protein [Clostridium sp. AF15-41]